MLPTVDVRGAAALEPELERLARSFPEPLVASQLTDVPRMAFHLRLVLNLAGAGASLCDIGSGVGMFGLACAQRGMRVTMMDDFGQAINRELGDSVLDFHRGRGVTVTARDPLREGFGFGPETLDVVTIIDSMEHWHQSPKRLFQEVTRALRPGGWLVIGGPNCVNLRKRISVPLGRGKWSSIGEWYEEETFRGHVREPDVDDLHYIARDLGLEVVGILGRNWAGYINSNRLIRALTRFVDRPLQLRPSLCSDIYLVARKPAG